MILLDKKKEEMNEEELLKNSIMEVLVKAKGFGHLLSADEKQSVDFKVGSGFERAATMLLSAFDITKKNKNIDYSNSDQAEKQENKARARKTKQD